MAMHQRSAAIKRDQMPELFRRLAIDNNDVENAIRPTAVRKKNWMFIGDTEAAERSAIVLIAIEACGCWGKPARLLARCIHPYATDECRRLPEPLACYSAASTPAGLFYQQSIAIQTASNVTGAIRLVFKDLNLKLTF